MSDGAWFFPVQGWSWADYRDDPNLRGADRGSPGRGGWRYPRGNSFFHRGIDLKAPAGTPVLAVEPGRVLLRPAAPARRAAGHRVWFFGDSGAVYYYLHLGTDPGDPTDAYPPELAGRTELCAVAAGAVVGYLGYTGGSEASGAIIPAGSAHLHFEYRPGGVHGMDTNPAGLFDRMP